MEADYPAAHSMDTTWFAVDGEGHVGVFRSGKHGTVPEGAPEGDLSALLDHLRGAPAGRWVPLERCREEAAGLGLFWFEHAGFSELWPLAYTLVRRPPTPLHVDGLPPLFRGPAKRVRFDGVRFTECQSVQPVGHVPCRFWPGEQGTAYLAADGVTVRPVPGREDRFSAFCAMMWRERPEEAARLRFEWRSAD